MQRLRHATVLIRLVAAWFVLLISVGTVGPGVRAETAASICTSSGATKSLLTPAGTPPVFHHTLDCPLCISAAPPSPATSVALALEFRTAPPELEPVSHVAVRLGAPLPARGPPAHLLA